MGRRRLVALPRVGQAGPRPPPPLLLNRDRGGVTRRHLSQKREENLMDLKLEVIVVPVTDVDEAKHFYGTRLGCREDADVGGGGFRLVQMTPPGSGCSIAFGAGVTSAT